MVSIEWKMEMRIFLNKYLDIFAWFVYDNYENDNWIQKKQKGNIYYAVINDGAGRYRKNRGILRTEGDEAASAGYGVYPGW